MIDNRHNHSTRWAALWLGLALLMMGALPAADAARSLSLAWDQNAESDIAGYRVKYGTVGGNYTQTMEAGNATAATVPNLLAGTTYHVVVTAYNTASLESLPSSEGEFTTGSNQAPLVTLANPVSGSDSPAPASLTLAAAASDADGSVSRVEFYNGSTKLGEATSAPYRFTWSAVAAGSYSLTARAIDDEGLFTESSPINVTIASPPVVARPTIGVVNYLPDGTFQFTFNGQQAGANSVYASGDMVNWVLLSTVSNTNGNAVISDPAAVTLNQRFYKVQNANGVSDPVGFVKLRIASPLSSQSPAFSYIGTVMLNAVGYRGTVTALLPNAITDSTAIWTDNQFNGTNGEFYIEITSGQRAGLMADIVSTNAVTKTLITDDNLVSLLTGGEQYRIRKHRTLAEMFGANNEAGLVGGATVSSADEVKLLNPLTQSYLTFYFKTGGFGGAGWRSTTDAMADASGTKLYPDQGLIIKRKSGNGSTIVAKGAVKTGPTIVPIGSQSNLVANMYPAGQLTLGGAGLRQGDDLSGVAGGATVSMADEVRILTGAAFKTYFYKTGGFGGTGWRATSDALTDASATAIPVGAAIFVIRKNDRPAFSWAVPQPF